MKKAFRLFIFALVFAPSAIRSQDLDALAGLTDFDFGSGAESETNLDIARVNRAGVIYGSKEFVMSRFDGDVVSKFGDAWRGTGNGTTAQERVILILRMAGGGYSARLLSVTNDYKSCSFAWHPATIAVVHTHPNTSNPKPQEADIQIADKFGVLMFTITSRGMYLYDPATKQITKVQNELDWLKPSSWAKLKAQLKTE